MVATAALALGCLLTSQDSPHGSQYSSRIRSCPTTVFGVVSPFEYDPTRSSNRIANEHFSSPKTGLFRGVDVEVRDQDTAGTLKYGIDHDEVVNPEIRKIDSLTLKEVGRNVVKERPVVVDEFRMATVDGDQKRNGKARRILKLKVREQDVMGTIDNYIHHYQEPLVQKRNGKARLLPRFEVKVLEKDLVGTMINENHHYESLSFVEMPKHLLQDAPLLREYWIATFEEDPRYNRNGKEHFYYSSNKSLIPGFEVKYFNF
jgi:hypothetical protein